MVWQAEQDAKCPGCGQYREDCMTPDGKEYVGVPIRCRACEERDLTANKFAEPADRAGLYVAVKEVERIYYD